MREKNLSSEELIAMHERYIIQTYRPHRFVYSRAKGVWVWNPEGEKCMDMLSCYSAIGAGHCHPEILNDFIWQAYKYWPGSNAFYNDVAPLFAKELAEFCEMYKVLPLNTGAEAAERAIKIARKWGYTVKGIPKNKAKIIVCENNFHGRTTTIISASSHKEYKQYFGPLTPGFVIIPYGDLSALQKAITPNTAAFMVEPIQAEGGIIVPPDGYLKGAKEICEKNNVLFILDEIQTGLGRCGDRFAYLYDGKEAKPNILLLGKFLGGGVDQLSAVVCDEKTGDVLVYPEDGSTFQCHPLAMVAGRATLKLIVKENLPARSFVLGTYFREKLKAITGPGPIKEVRGKGLLIGVELKHELGGARPFVERLIKEGLLCNQTHEHTIRFAPPLTIEKEEIDWALRRIRKVLQN
jgi:ornithine--oxo-acid transaminase